MKNNKILLGIRPLPVSIWIILLLSTCSENDPVSMTCSDGILNQDETDIDCGGSCPDCPSCFDMILNQDETGVDCGGVCSPCPTCEDGEQNQDETGVDCGGICIPCPSCEDGEQNQDETGVDCGGVCSPCPLELAWEKSLGGSQDERARSIILSADGGFIVVGVTASGDGDVSNNHGGYDSWIVKLNSTGSIEWEKTLGGSSNDWAESIINTNDGGFAIVGSTESSDGDISNNHGGSDMWVIKLSSSGNIEWEKALGGSLTESGQSIIQASDGGYTVAGFTGSSNGDVSSNQGNRDFWVVKLSSSGNLEWEKTFGGSQYDRAESLIQTDDDGYVVLGATESNNGDVSNAHGGSDLWIIKLSSSGNMEWEKTLGGSQNDWGSRVVYSDNGFTLLGDTFSNDGDVSFNHGDRDIWLVRLSTTGTLEWERTLGGSDADYDAAIYWSDNEGYFLVGSTNSNDGDVSDNHGDLDIWLAKLSTTGTLEWERTLGGSLYDVGNSIIRANEGIGLLGGTFSSDGDVSSNHGNQDFWVVKFE